MRGRSTSLAVATLFAISLALTPAASAPAAADAGTSHPRLLFGPDEVAGLRQRTTSGIRAQAWEGLKLKAERHLQTVLPELAEDGGYGPNLPSIMMDLSFAYLLGGEQYERYGRHAIELMLAVERGGWPVQNSNELGRGMLGRGLALSFDWTYDLMTADERTTIISSLVDELPPLDSNGVHEDVFFSCLDPDWWGHHGLNNWLGVCGGGAGLLLLAIEGEPGTPDLSPWITRARDRTVQHIGGHPYPRRTIHGSGGDGSEGVWYTFFGLRHALPFGFAYKRLKGEDILAINPGLRNVPVWLAFEQIPGEGGLWEPRNDSFTHGGQGIYDVASMLFAIRPDGVTGWLWDQTVGPDGEDTFAPPYQASPIRGSSEVFAILYYRSAEELPRINPADASPLSRHYPERGLVHFRTGFSGTTHDIRASFEARRNSFGHSQSDLGNFTISGYGTRFALDSGYPFQDGGDPANHTAAGHNVIIVDNQNATQWPGASRLNFNTIPYYVDSPNLTFVRSDVRPAYAWQGPGDTSLVPWADRNVLFSRTPGEPVLVAVSDNLNRSGGNHVYTWQIHTDGTHSFLPTTSNSFVSVAPNTAAMAGAVTEAHGPRVLTARSWRGPAARPQTLVASRDALNAKRPTLDHLTVLAITPPGTTPATTTALSAEGGTAAAVEWDGGRALVASAAHGSDGVESSLTMTGSFGKVTVGKGETILDEGTSLHTDGREYLTATAPSSVVVSGDRIIATGPEGTTYRAYAPQTITSVTVNDQPVQCVRDGDYVSFPPADFTVTVTPDEVSEKKNTDTSIEVGVSPHFGFSQPVALSIDGLPEGFTATFDNAIVDPGTSTTLTLRAGPDVRPGTYTFEVVGEAGGLRRTATVTFHTLDDDHETQ